MTKSHQRADANTIVVGTDGSPGSEAALEWAVKEAFGSRRRVLVVHAFPLAETMVLAPLTLVGFPDGSSYGTDVLRRAADYCGEAGVTFSTMLAEGSAADCLVDASDGAAMLVLGARGRGHAAALLLGSVSQDCARRARCPVVLIKPAVASEKTRSHAGQVPGGARFA